MRILRVTIITGLIILLISPVLAHAANEAVDRSWINGNYQVKVKSGNYSPYVTDITVTNLPGNAIEVKSNIDGLPIVLRGEEVATKTDQQKVSYQCNINNDFFMGQVVLSFQKADQENLVNGYGSGVYHYMGRSGSGSATLTGAEETSHFNEIFIICLILFAVGLAVILMVRKRQYN